MNYENLFLCRHSEEQEWDGGRAFVGILKCHFKVRNGEEGEGGREDFGIGAQYSDCGFRGEM